MLSKESKTPSCWRANSGLLMRCHHQSTMVFDNLINAVTCWWFFQEVCSRVRSAWVESETRTCIQRLELNQSSPLFKVSFKLNTWLCYISLFSGCWNLDINLNTCTEIFMTQQCLQFEGRWSPWHRLILRSRKPGVTSLKDRLCEHLSSSVSQLCKCFRRASSPSAALPRAHQIWSSSGTGGGQLGFPSTWSNLIRDFDLCWRIAMIRDNCLVNISVADRFMKEAVYHIQVGYNVRSIVNMIIQLVIAMKAK